MKFRILVSLILLGTLASGANAQSNCCDIQVGGQQIANKGITTVPPDGNGPGGTYIAMETIIYPLNCVNSDTAKPCNSTSPGNNSVTVNGAGGNYAGGFVNCIPSTMTTTTHASKTSGAAATFVQEGTSYAGFNSTTGTCTPANPEPSADSSCIVQACATTSGGCGTIPPPPTCPKTAGCIRGSSGCPTPQWNSSTCSWACVVSPNSPILIDVSGNGFQLTSAASGVTFDISGAGNPIQMAWTASGADNAFLALPGADGLIHSGQQLFGNFTPQPQSDNPNGFAALAVYDLPANGGNGNGMIDAGDAVFASLRLWIDANHDGISQPNELFTLSSLGVTSIGLTYKWDGRTDQYGNMFRYRAQVNPGDPASTGRIAYDVFFTTSQPTSNYIPRGLIPHGGGLIPADAHKCEVPGTKDGLLATGKK